LRHRHGNDGQPPHAAAADGDLGDRARDRAHGLAGAALSGAGLSAAAPDRERDPTRTRSILRTTRAADGRDRRRGGTVGGHASALHPALSTHPTTRPHSGRPPGGGLPFHTTRNQRPLTASISWL